MAAMTPEEAVAHVLATDPAFELHEVDVRGVTVKAFKNIPGNVPGLLAAGWARHGDGTLDYLAYEGEVLTYAAFTRMVHRVAHAMRDELGLRQGDRVAVALRNYPELLALVLAISSFGGVVVFLNAWWTSEELDYALRDSGAKVIFADRPRMARLKPLQDDLGLTLIGVRDGEGQSAHDFTSLRDSAEADTALEVVIDTDDDFAVMYSSGTTGHPKGVVQTHRGAVNAVFSWLLQAVIAPLVEPPEPDAPEPPRPSALVVTPLFHVTATHPLFLLSLPAGAKITLMRKWDAGLALELIEREKITSFTGVPTMTMDILAHPDFESTDTSTLVSLGSGGAPNPPHMVEKVSTTTENASPTQGYGLSEVSGIATANGGPMYLAKPGSCGLKAPVSDMKVIDDEGNELPAGERGELCIYGPHVFAEYHNKPEATAEAIDPDGWFHTGDVAIIDEEGYVFIVDRAKDLVIRGGENIGCAEVEAAIAQHPAVHECAVFGVPDERLGEEVGVAVFPIAGQELDPKELQTFAGERLASFKVPAHVFVYEAPLPKNANGKILKRQLREEAVS